jgi:tRNA-uridine 2-sulfurtransferase
VSTAERMVAVGTAERMVAVGTAERMVAVGMSGGVDSSVAALLVQRTGCRVVGVTMRIYGGDLPGGCAPGACYGPDEEQDAASARQVCSALGIPFVEVDLRAEYRARVLDYFSREYRAGRTPNPCVRCNQELKFGLLLERLQSEAGIRADRFATGHYARVGFDPGPGRHTLRAGIEPVKDQSYFLCMLTQGQLARAVFPLGGMRKAEVRAAAREAGLAVHDRAESQDFAAGDYRAMVGPGAPASEGFFRTAAGQVVGRHKGVWAYTIGQRRGLGIGAGEPLYVTGIDPSTNTVFVGPAAELDRTSLVTAAVNWVSIAPPAKPVRAAVKVRSQQQPAPGLVIPRDDGSAEVRFDQPQRAVAPGQWAVFYDGELLLGGAVIEGSA